MTRTSDTSQDLRTVLLNLHVNPRSLGVMSDLANAKSAIMPDVAHNP